MNIKPEQTYKLVETEGHLSIIPPDMNVADPTAQPLIVADKEKLCDYLMAYLSNRELMKPLKEAHHAAMDYVGITLVRR